MRYKKERFICAHGALTIRGFLLRPELEAKLPAVIVSHGFASNSRDTQRYAKVFAEAGYATVYFDFCGAGRGKSDGRSVDMSF